jgi:hypothetical protein
VDVSLLDFTLDFRGHSRLEPVFRLRVGNTSDPEDIWSKRDPSDPKDPSDPREMCIQDYSSAFIDFGSGYAGESLVESYGEWSHG